MNKKDMTFLQALNKHKISMFGDVDRDKVPNVFDCKPLDPNRDGLFGRAVNILSGGRYGQSKEAYDTEKLLKRVEVKHKLESKIDTQKAENALIRQKIELQKLKAKQQQLKALQQLQTLQQPSLGKRAVSFVFGIPQPQSSMLSARPGYYIESTGPRLPKGYHWKKIPKSKKKSEKTMVCPHCSVPLMVMPGPFGQPVLRCPSCGSNYQF